MARFVHQSETVPKHVQLKQYFKSYRLVCRIYSFVKCRSVVSVVALLFVVVHFCRSFAMLQV